MEELAEAKVVVLMLSPESVKRPWVNFEAGAAWTRDIVIIPVCFGDLKKGELPKPYSSVQAIDLMDWDDQYYLARSVAHYLEIEEPSAHIFGVQVAEMLGGPEAKRKAERETNAYKNLRENLSELERARVQKAN